MLEQSDIDFMLTEMFNRVGAVYTQEAVTKEDWYLTHSWSIAEQESYKMWLIKWLRSKYKILSKKQAEREAGWIILYCGWRQINE